MPRRQTKKTHTINNQDLYYKTQVYSKGKSNQIRNNNILGRGLDIDEENLSGVVLDPTNILIMEALVNHGEIKSSEIAEKLKIPLSTIQRRRTRIEKSLLKKKYQIDLKQLGYRTAQIFVDIQGGKAKEVGEELLQKFDRNIVSASTRINSSSNLCIDVLYNGSEELHNLLEEIKSIPLAAKVDWSEQIMILGDNTSKIIKNTLSDRL